MAARMTIAALNDVLGVELDAINQYFVHAKGCEHWGYERLAERFRKDSIEEMKDAEQLMDRVLELGGLPQPATAQRVPGRRGAQGAAGARAAGGDDVVIRHPGQ